MSQQDTSTNPDPQDAKGESGEAQNPTDTGRTYTEAEFNAMVTARLSKHEKALRKTWEAELEAERKKAEMTEAERYKAELEERDKRIQALEAERTRATRTAALAGKVTDTEYALWKLEQAGDKYLTDDGVDVDAFLKDHPSLKAQPDPKPGPAPTTAGGGSAKGADMNTFIRQKAGKA